MTHDTRKIYICKKESPHGNVLAGGLQCAGILRLVTGSRQDEGNRRDKGKKWRRRVADRVHYVKTDITRLEPSIPNPSAQPLTDGKQVPRGLCTILSWATVQSFNIFSTKCFNLFLPFAR